ncbi:MAG TPA: hypothetical protein VK576_06110 [Thermoleophilia bacterium]|nr:hypothetical protein [Thermoleophilia bacterium]
MTMDDAVRTGGSAWAARDAVRAAPLWLRIAFPALLLALIVTMMGLPQLLRTVAVRPYIPIANMTGQVSGTYVSTSGGLAKLYPYPERLGSFPPGAAVAAPATVLRVRARQLSEQRLYYLTTYAGQHPVPVAYKTIDRHTLELLPAARLAPGEYVITAARDSADAAFDYFYFRVR